MTLDKDFAELAIVYEKPHSGIIRLVNLPSYQQASICMRVLQLYEKELKAGVIVTVDQNRIRIRSAKSK